MRDKANKILAMCENGTMDPIEVLENVFTNWMSADEAEEFCEQEYSDDLLDLEEEDDEDEERFSID